MIKLFGTQMQTLSMQETIEAINIRINNNIFTQHVVVNVAKIVNMQRDALLRDSVNSSDLINIDGVGLLWGAKLFSNDVTERVSGIDLFYELLKSAEKTGKGVFFLGATQSVLAKTLWNIKKQYPDLNVSGVQHGYYAESEEQGIAEKINKSGAEFLFVAMSSPKKENFINRWKNKFGVSFVMGVGGTFDIVAGKTQRAPVWMQKSGLEWFYRVMQEPARLWKRYLYTNSKFALMLIRASFDKDFRIQGNRKIEHESFTNVKDL
ncbi:MAG: WecB/TagA/CpsF family glycosyltransferase [Thiotrichaceae bacterium]